MPRFSAATKVSGPALKVPVDTVPDVDMWCICAPVSDEPTPSMTIAFGRTSIRRCLMYGVSSAPPLATTANDDTSAMPFSMAATRGRAIGVADHRHGHHLLPLDGADHIVGVQMVDNRREDDGLARRDRRHHTPLRRAVNQRRQNHQLGAGAPGQPRHDLVERAGGLAGHQISPAERRHEDVVLTPQHAFRHPGRAAGVEDVQIVGRMLERRASTDSELMMVS